MLLERLRVCATDSLSDPEVKEKCRILFRAWAATYKATPGMERVVALQKQLPKRKKPVTQQQSRVLKETQPSANEDPFGSADDEPARTPGVSSTPTASSFASSSSTFQTGGLLPTVDRMSKKSKADKKSKVSKSSRAFNLESEKSRILESIASASIASTNLMNALKLIDREHKRVSEDPDTVNRFERCKQLRRQILRYIQHIESEQWLGSLINANDTLVEALMAFEILDKSVENDSDSEGAEWSDGDQPARSEPRQEGLETPLAGLSLGKQPAHPTMLLNGRGQLKRDDDSEGDSGDADDDDPFADKNAVHTPKGERPGMTWREV